MESLLRPLRISVLFAATYLLTACTQSSVAPQVSTTGRPTAVDPPCSELEVSASAPEGVTGGGLAFNMTLASQRDCGLTAQPAVAILDADGKLLTLGLLDVSKSNVIKRGKGGVAGEWRNVCTEARFPLGVVVLAEGKTFSGPMAGRRLPVCFGANGSPAERTSKLGRGSLNASVE